MMKLDIAAKLDVETQQASQKSSAALRLRGSA
jgi:hypothetical protein